MVNKRKWTNLSIIAILVLLVGLTGCNSSSETPTSTATSQPASNAASPTALAEGTAAPVSTVQAASCARLNLNALTEDQLMSTIPNFSSRMVREFFEYRPYVSIQQFRREIGKYVDASQVAEYEKYVYVPVDPNNSDADTLKQLPGVDDAVAAELINGRPYASSATFVQALTTHVDAQQLAESTCYLVAQP
ncbi:MAG TPA: hypothetical protein VJ183_03705 [Chloroflexia bacterium]|nr:hypothetical protein [Chloroflexia bacterium]